MDQQAIKETSLIECLREIEGKFAHFLSEGQGKYLATQIKSMYLESSLAIERIGSKFKDVVEPILLDQFKGNWAAFILWDDFNKTFHILHKYPSQNQTDINAEKYQFVSRFLNFIRSQENFIEPMTDILFREATRKRALIFRWGRSNQTSGPDEPLPGKLQALDPVTIYFEGLNKTQSIANFKELDKFVEQNCSSNDERVFKELWDGISELAKNILAEEAGRETFQSAVENIDQAFKNPEDSLRVESLVKPDALCRSLLWNRLLDHTWEYIYYIPARFLEGSAVSGIVCALKQRLQLDDYVILTQIVNRIFSVFHFGLYKEELLLFAMRSATAAIMARNKSHIHGSHIEHGLRNRMGSFEKIVNERLSQQDDFYKNLRKMLTL